MRTLLILVAVSIIHPGFALGQSSFSANTPVPELEVPVRRASPVVRPATSVAPPAAASAGKLDSNATFRPGDTFELRLSGMPSEDALEFSQPFTIGTDGYLTIPLAGQIRAAGLTQSQLERAIERKLVEEEIFRFPTAAINVATQARYVTVGGAVRSPNRIPWSSDLTLLTAISASGGPNDFGGDKVELIRGGKMVVFSTKKIRRDPSQDPRLFPGDRLEQR
jgi:protein involved in polysaccharide export with SLBB domain